MAARPLALQINALFRQAFDSAGNIYIAEYGNNRVRKVAAGTGIITTVAGNGTAGYSGDGGQATSAELMALKAYTSIAQATFISRTLQFQGPQGGCRDGRDHYGGGQRDSWLLGGWRPSHQRRAGAPWRCILDSAGNLYITDYNWLPYS